MNSALDLYERAGLAPGLVRLEDLDKFQDVLPDYQIKVVSACYLNTISTVENQTCVKSFIFTSIKEEIIIMSLLT